MTDKKTSTKVAKIASKKLKNNNIGKNTKSVAGSVLAQSKTKKVTSKKVATKASQVLRDGRTSDKGKKVAGSGLS